MDHTIFVFLLVFTVNQCIIHGLSVEEDLKIMDTMVANQTQLVTEYAAGQNKNTLSEQEEIGYIIAHHVKAFNKDFTGELKALKSTIKAEREKSALRSSRFDCLNQQKAKIDPLQQVSDKRAVDVQATVDKQVKELVDATSQVMHDIQGTMQVNVIVQLCMKVYPAIDEVSLRAACFDQFSYTINSTDKTIGETLLERVDGIQQQSMTIAQQADTDLRNMYVQNHLDLAELSKNVEMCITLPGPQPEIHHQHHHDEEQHHHESHHHHHDDDDDDDDDNDDDDDDDDDDD